MEFIKIKVKPHQTETTLTDLAILMRPFTLLAPNDFQINWPCNRLTMSIPHEDYSRHASCALN